MQNLIKVLIVDDSVLVRQGLAEMFSQTDDIEVIGTAADPYVAVEKMRKLSPDVIILDVEMPRMDGITFLKKIMAQHPIPVIICSSLIESGSDVQVRALEYGAVDIMTKPKTGTKAFIAESAIRFADAVRAAARARVKPTSAASKTQNIAPTSLAQQNAISLDNSKNIILIGASTGGTVAIRQILQAMPANCPPIAIVQHMPEGFTRSFAQRLDEICTIKVKEASNNDSLVKGQALIAPGNRHMLVRGGPSQFYVQLKGGPLVSRHRPSVNVMFKSASQVLGRKAVGVILTGMGSDGASGLLELKQSGAFTLGQSEQSCVVYGMPKEAYKLGAVDKQVDLKDMVNRIIFSCASKA